MRATASPGMSSTVSITTNTTPSKTGTANSRRRAMKVSTSAARRPSRPRHYCQPLLVEPDLSEPEVVLDRMHRETLYARAGDDDLLGIVHGDPHHLPGEDVLRLGVELLALGLVHAPARLLDQGIHLGVGVARGVPARRRHLLGV